MRLSLCIPTYNRATQLRDLFNSIVRQIDYSFDVEIVVSDNASCDDTHVVIANYQRAGLHIVYRKLPDNLGFDRNIINVVSLSSGDYCWLFGSDDILEDGAFSRIEKLFARHTAPTGISVGANGYTADMTQRIKLHDHISTDFTEETILIGQQEIIKGVGPWGLGYISSIIIRREAWCNAVITSPVDEYLNGYIHIYILARVLDHKSTWICVPDRLVGWRSGNDSAFSSQDAFKRTRLDLIGFDQSFGGALGRKNPAYRATMSKVATFYIRSHFITAKMNGVSGSYWQQAIPMSVARYWRYPSFWSRTLPIALIPRPVLLFLIAIRRGGHKALSIDT